MLSNNATVGSTGNIFNATGNTLPRAPVFSFNVGLHYSHTFVKGVLDLNATDYYTTKIRFDPVNQFSQNAYSILRAQTASWTDKASRKCRKFGS